MKWADPLRSLIRRRSGFPLPVLHVLWERYLVAGYRRQACAMGFGTPLQLDRLRGRKTSDTLFILGCGTSINRLSEGQWREIGASDSMACNFWPIHDFVPTFYMFEFPGEPDRRRTLHDLLSVRADAYARTPFILKSVWPQELPLMEHTIPPAVRERLVIDASVSIPPSLSPDPAALHSSLRQLRLFGMTGMSFFRTGSMSYMLFLGARLGYRRMVFCGTDLLDTDYFFYDRREHYEAKGRPIPTNIQDGKVHRTMEPPESQLAPGILDVLGSTDRIVCRPRGIRLFVAHQGSALSARFPVFPWRRLAQPE